MRLRHPYSLDEDPPDPDGRVHYGGRRDVAEVDDDGTFEIPDRVAESFVEAWPTAEGYSLEELRVPDPETDVEADVDEPEDDGPSDEEPETCQHVITSGDREGEVCGRELPCPYHSED